MAKKSAEDIRRIVKKALASAKTDSARQAFIQNHVKILAKAPYNLTLSNLVRAHDDPSLPLKLGDPWQGGG